MEVYHYSEEPNIAQFVPRPPPARVPGLPGSASPVAEGRRVVWAIDAWHSPLYYFPRDCPRIMFWPLATTTRADREHWLGASSAERVGAIEWGWLERVRTTRLYRYVLDATAFARLEGPNVSPGTSLSDRPVTPTRVEILDDLLRALREAGVELRLMPTLTALKDVWSSTLHASGVRLRNAAAWPRSE